ncbi:hypothetical protein [Cognatilysobacter bugurensis]|uniref:Uncharacterized protein n=1 Tax=Cognatilysobacter bugurensis TaxID=543356 RepID=A0A918SZP0_9GAMM|nr:hypothetical protein [Lysobacter bugurensis]GHA77090.1 hypothetical protein GCM10007067_13000 [Lysobacter bugurensis]
MPRQTAPAPWWTRTAAIAAAVMLVACVLAIARCAGSDRSGQMEAAQPATGGDEPVASVAPASTQPETSAADAAAHARRTQAVSEAIDAVHAYLQAVGAQDFETADALWQPNRRPAAQDESGLRELGPLRALRIQNLSPALPTGNEIPASLEVPVQLVAHLESDGPVRLNGHYRMRRDPVRARWEISGASLRLVIR